MSQSVIFDTHAFVKKLKQSGFEEAQAEALSDAFKEAQKAATEDLATKADIQELELRIHNKFESVKGELTLLKWMLGIVIAGILSLILKAFFVP